jgi:hypothetical protein
MDPGPSLDLAPTIALQAALGLIGVMAATAMIARTRGRRLADYGLSSRGAARRLAQGALCGALAMTAIAGGLLALGALTKIPSPSAAAAQARAGLEWTIAFILVALAQEIAFRGVLLGELTRRWGFAPAVLVSSLLFAAIHLGEFGRIAAPLDAAGLAGLLVFGVLAAASVRGAGAIWWAVGFHAAWDLAQVWLFGFPSYGRTAAGALTRLAPRSADDWFGGGAFGPEASPLAIGLLGLSAAAWLALPRRTQA